MNNTDQNLVFNYLESQLQDGEIKEGAGSGDAMLGWFTDEEFDQVADSIVNHFESITGNVEGELDEDLTISEIVGWLIKESIKLMPDSALKYVRYLVDEQLNEHASPSGMDEIYEESVPGRSVLMSEVY